LSRLKEALKKSKTADRQAAETLTALVLGYCRRFFGARTLDAEAFSSDLAVLLVTGEANCVSLSMLYLILADEIGLRAQGIDVSEPTCEGEKDGHAAVLVWLTGEKMMIADTGKQARLVFPYSAEFHAQSDRIWRLKIKGHNAPLFKYRKFRLLSDRGCEP